MATIYTSTPHIGGLVVQVAVGEEQIEVIHTFLGTCVLKVVYFPLDGAHVNGIFHYLEVVLNLGTAESHTCCTLIQPSATLNYCLLASVEPLGPLA